MYYWLPKLILRIFSDELPYPQPKKQIIRFLYSAAVLGYHRWQEFSQRKIATRNLTAPLFETWHEEVSLFACCFFYSIVFIIFQTTDLMTPSLSITIRKKITNGNRFVAFTVTAQVPMNRISDGFNEFHVWYWRPGIALCRRDVHWFASIM